MTARTAAATFAVSLLLAGCGGEDGKDGSSAVRTTDDGLVISSGVTSPAILKVEAQDDSLLAEPTKATPAKLKGAPLGASCRFAGAGDQAGLGTIVLQWREDFGDWGARVFPSDYDTTKLPNLADGIRSCDIRAGEPVGADQVDLNAGDPVARVTFKPERP